MPDSNLLSIRQSPSIDAQISDSVERLRRLTQITVQSQWRACFADVPLADATQCQTWDTWAIAPLNAREHLAWPRGRQVMWLGQRLVVPPDLQGYPLEGLSWRIELTWWAELAQIFVNGSLVQEGDLFDCSTRLLLSQTVSVGETVDIALRLVSPGHDEGALVRSHCLYERPDHSLEPCPEPGFVADELAVLQAYLTAIAPHRLEELAAAVAHIDWPAVGSPSFDQSLLELRQTLQPFSPWMKQRGIQLVGHAHLDLAWLWPVSETWTAAERTFQSVLDLQETFPELIFCHSTPALYDWVETHRPELFATLRDRVAAGTWEVVAGLWVEPELNTVGGEAIARQVLYGQRYVQAKFGQLNRVAWLPDTFGFCWQLPQILQQGGVDYFVTQKLRWNDSTTFPHELFRWRSPDGSSMLSLHSAPIGERIDPIKMSRYASQWETQTGQLIALWLPGVGDHGGGPSRDMLELARRWARSPFFPRVEFGSVVAFLDQLAAQYDPPISSPTASPDPTRTALPDWNDELYLEFHRGCYTSHADQKRFNRRCERSLYAAELYAAIATCVSSAPYPQIELETAWKKVLFNQFHDILPGSAIPEVYTDANRDWQAALQTAEQIKTEALAAIATHIEFPPAPHPQAEAIVIFNALNWERSQVMELASPTPTRIYSLEGEELVQDWHNGTLQFLTPPIPGLGYRCCWLCPAPLPDAASDARSKTRDTVESYLLENEWLRVTVDPATGDLDSVVDLARQQEILAGPGNQLQAFQDGGQYWDAWNIDPNYASHPLPPAQLLSIDPVQGHLRRVIRVRRAIGQSIFEQQYVLDPGSAVLQIHTQVLWNEPHTLVKAAFPLNLTADYATYEIPFGAIARPTRPQTQAEQAKWECPALHWVDLSDDAWGVSLLNDCKYGYDHSPSQLRLTLLRGSTWPDPGADVGQIHSFTYGLYPHGGDWRSAQTVRRGYELNQPLDLLRRTASSLPLAPALPAAGQFLTVPVAANFILTAFKQAEDSSHDWILRGYECHGETVEWPWSDQAGLAMGQALPQRVNLLEQSTTGENSTSCQTQAGAIAPWQIVTARYRPTA